jgi:2-methylcitrate dehydratase
MAALTEEIARFTAGVRYQDMPPEGVAAIKRLVLDAIGCALGAVGCDPAMMLAPLLRPATGPGDTASLLGSGRAVSVEGAILFNGTLLRYLDFMDVYWARDICHPSENIPVALACAQSAHASGQALIAAIAAAYEVQVRLADAFSLEAIDMHHVSAAGFVAPLIMGKLWGLGIDQTAHACALGGFRHLTHSALLHGRLSMAKSIGYAAPASECVMSTHLAARGFTGPLTVLERMGVHGLDLSPGTGSALRVSMKRFPVQFTLQSPIEAALSLRNELRGDVSLVEELRVEVLADVCKRTADPAKFSPDNRETADHSMPCCVAMALLDGKLDARAFAAERWRDADVRGLMRRIQVEPSQELEARWPKGRPARVTATLRGGAKRSVLVETPLGDAARPMTDAQVQHKFMDLAVPAIGKDKAEALVQEVGRLDQLADVGTVAALAAA